MKLTNKIVNYFKTKQIEVQHFCYNSNFCRIEIVTDQGRFVQTGTQNLMQEVPGGWKEIVL